MENVVAVDWENVATRNQNVERPFSEAISNIRKSTQVISPDFRLSEILVVVNSITRLYFYGYQNSDSINISCKLIAQSLKTALMLFWFRLCVLMLQIAFRVYRQRS